MARRSHAPTTRVWTLIGVLLALCVPVLVLAPEGPLVSGWYGRPAVVAFVLAFGLMELLVFDIPLGRERHTISWNELFVVLAIVVLPTGVLMGSYAVGLGTFLAVRRRQTLLRWSFNLAQGAVSVGIGAHAAHAVAARISGTSGPWFGAFAGACTSGILSAVLVSLVVSIVESQRPHLRRMFDLSTFVVVGAAAGGVLLGVCAQRDRALAVFPLLTFGLLAFGHRSYVRAKLRADERAFLDEATLALNSGDVESSIADLLAATCRAIHVREAMLVENFDDDQWIAHWIDRSEPGSPLHSSIGGRPAWLVDTLPACVLGSAALADDRGGDALVAPIRSDRGVIGVLVARGRAENFGAFESSDMVLIQTATGLLSLHLQSGELRRDLNDLHEAERELRRLAHHDALTGLANRRQLDAHLSALWAGSDAATRSLSIAVVDLDGFKGVNDRHGHATGDLLLVDVAERLRSIVRDDDLAVRLGGDEFAVLGSDHPAVLRERVTAAFAAPFLHDGVDLCCGASVGAAPVDGTRGVRAGRSIAELRRVLDRALAEADREMYAVKAAHHAARDSARDPARDPAPLRRSVVRQRAVSTRAQLAGRLS